MDTPFPNPTSNGEAAHPASYGVRLSWKLGFCVLGFLFVAGGALGMWYFGMGHEVHDAAGRVIMVVICAAFALLGLYVALWMLQARVALLPEGIELSEIFRKRFLRNEDILGWRTLQQQNMPPLVVLVARPGHGRALKLSQSMEFDANFYAWLQQFDNLDAKEQEQSEKEILENTELAGTPEERAAVLQRGKKTAGAFSALTFAAAVWGWFYPQPYRVVIAVLAAIPLVALLVVIRSGGLYRLDEKKNDIHPNLAGPFIIPGLVLALRATMDIGIIDWSRVIAVSAAVGIVLCVIAILSDPTLRSKPLVILIVFFVTAAYGYGASLEANALLDRSSAQLFVVQVLHKHASTGKNTDYQLTLSPWGPRRERNKVSVRRVVYDSVQNGGRVCVLLHEGALRIPWYTVHLCTSSTQ